MSVTLSLFAGAGAQFFDNNGNPLSGGKLYTYQAGTTTPLATYTSNAGSAFHTNPIILDAAGRVPSGGEIWLQLGIGYKFVVKTSADVLIATYDNIPSSAQPPAANDADSIMYEQGSIANAGSFTVGQMYRILNVGDTDFTSIGASSNTPGTHFIATGAGAGTGTAELSQTVEEKLRQYVSVKDFDAIGDGVTDDTLAFENAIASCCASGQSLFIPAGQYIVAPASAIEITKGIGIYGEGPEVTQLIHTSDSTLFLANPLPRLPGANVYMSNFSVVQNNGANARFCDVRWQYGAGFERLLIRGSDTGDVYPNHAFIVQTNDAPGTPTWVEGTYFRDCVFEGPAILFFSDPTGTESFSRTHILHCFFTGADNGYEYISIRGDARLYDCFFQLHYILPSTNTLLKMEDTSAFEQSWFSANGEAGAGAKLINVIDSARFNASGSVQPDGTTSSGNILLSQRFFASGDTITSYPVVGTVDLAYGVGGETATSSLGRAQATNVDSPVLKYRSDGDRNGLVLAKETSGGVLDLDWFISAGGRFDHYGQSKVTSQNDFLFSTSADGSAFNNGLSLTNTASGSGSNVNLPMLVFGDYDAFYWGAVGCLRGAGIGGGTMMFYDTELTTGTQRSFMRGNYSGVTPGVDNVTSLGSASYRWTVVYAATGTINTSDERQKEIKQDGIDAAVLRAWGNVKYEQFKFKDAIAKKGDGARWHFGLIAQRVKAAFEAEGLDAFEYGLLCYDEWEDEWENVIVREKYVDENGKEKHRHVATGEKKLTRAAGSSYGIRYEEALALECAYLRSKLEG